jgi:hypothetical protein
MSIGAFLAKWRPAPLAILGLGFLLQSSVDGMVAHSLLQGRVALYCSPKSNCAGSPPPPPGGVLGACFALSLMPVGEL